MQYSAGIIPFRVNDNDEMEFFVGHPGGIKWEKQNYWAFLKGGVENGEDWVTAALREFKEESGVDISLYNDKLIPLGSTIQNPQKTVIAYGIYYPNINPLECFSNIADNCLHPEIDKYQWMTFKDICKCTHNKHLIFYDNLNKLKNEYKNN